LSFFVLDSWEGFLGLCLTKELEARQAHRRRDRDDDESHSFCIFNSRLSHKKRQNRAIREDFVCRLAQIVISQSRQLMIFVKIVALSFHL
jgi:hypothetical protein